MKNTFTGLVQAFPNRGIHAVVAEAMTFRKQLTLRREFTSQSGWNDALNDYIKRSLEALALTVKRVTYSPSSDDPAANKARRIAEAKDTTTPLAAAYDQRSINSDDLVMAAGVVEKELPYDFTGIHPDFPQPTIDKVENDWARMLIAGLDNFVCAATNLDSRTQPVSINAFESAQLLALLNELYSLAMEKGGEDNRVETPTGVMASDRPSTFNASGEFDPPGDTVTTPPRT